MTSLTSSEFEQMQSQLLELKTQLYETREREARANKQRDAALAQAEQAKQAVVQPSANASSNGSGQSFQAINEDGTASSETLAGGSTAPSASSGSSGTLSNLLSSVKRNSVSLSAAISHAAHGHSGPVPTQLEKLQAELASVRAQAANEAEESSAQMTALKMNVQHLHKKATDLEKQNATLMTHLSNLEEERQSLAEKRERELKKRKARAEGIVDEVEDEEDLDKAKEKWREQKDQFEKKIAGLNSELTQTKEILSMRDAELAKVTLKLQDEQKNFERILLKVAEKDDALRAEKEENHAQQALIRELRAGGAGSSNINSTLAAPSPSPAAQSLTSPKSPSTFRNFFNKITSDKDKSDTQSQQQPQPPQSSPTPTTTMANDDAPSSSPTPSAQPPSTPLKVAPSDAGSATASTSAVPHSPSSPSSPPPEIPPWSSTQPLDEQILSLQHELSNLKVMNEHLLSSIQKKDARIRTVQDDCERVMNKLTEKEMMIHSLRDTNLSLEEIAKESKKKDAQIQKLQEQIQKGVGTPSQTGTFADMPSQLGSTGSNPSSSASSAAELKAATDAIAIVHQEFDQLKETLENTKDMLFLAETQLIDKQKIVSEQIETIRDLRASSEANESTIGNLIGQKDRLEKELNEHIDYLERKCLAEVQEWERKYDEDIAAAQKELQSLQTVRTELQAELQEALRRERNLAQELETLKQEHSTLRDSYSTLQSTHTALTTDLSDLKQQASIETRKRNHLVVELKEALKKELIKSKEQAARLKSAEDDIVTLKVMNQHQISASGGGVTINMTDESLGGSALNTPGGSVGGDQSNLGANGTNGGASQSGLPNAQTPSNAGSNSNTGGNASGKGVEQEVTIALAQKLAELQNDKHTLLKQRRALEEHIDLLSNDVTQKKEMIRNLVRRIETGALSTSQADSVQKTQQMFTQLTMEAKQQLFEKMEIILQETTLQNAQYKNNLQSMGEEITKLMAELEEQRTELSTLKEESDFSKDELELAQQSSADSAALVRSIEQAKERSEKVLITLLKKLETEGVLEEALSGLEPDQQQFAKQLLLGKPGGAGVGSRAPSAPSTPAHPPPAAREHHLPPRKTSSATASAADDHVKVKAAELAAAERAAKALAEKQAEDDRIEAMQREMQQMKIDQQKRESQEQQERADRIAAERRAAAKEEEERREKLFAEAESLSAAYDVSGNSARSPSPRQRSASELLADLDTSTTTQDQTQDDEE